MKTVVIGVIGADVHAVGNKILAFAFEQAGFEIRDHYGASSLSLILIRFSGVTSGMVTLSIK